MFIRGTKSAAVLATAVFGMGLVNLAGCSKSAEEIAPAGEDEALTADSESGGASEAGSGGEAVADDGHGHTAEELAAGDPHAGDGGVMGPSADGLSYTLPGLVFDKPVVWVSEMPANTMRLAQFAIPAPAAAEGAEAVAGPPTVLIVSYFGTSGAGPVQANLERWAGQVAMPDGSSSLEQAVYAESEVNGMKVHLVEVSGTQVAETTPGSGIRVNNPGSTLLGAIVETSAGPYYFKLVGPSDTVDPFKADFAAMIESFRSP